MSIHTRALTNQVVASAAVPITLEVPTKGVLTGLAVAQAAAGTFTITLHSRLLIGSTINLVGTVSTPTGKTRLLLLSDPGVRIGDLVTVASTSVVGYNTTHTVTAVNRRSVRNAADNGVATLWEIDTDQTWTADATGGTAKLDLTTVAGIYQLYTQSVSGSTSLVGMNIPYVNQDARRHDGATPLGRLYLTVSATGTYHVGTTVEQPRFY